MQQVAKGISAKAAAKAFQRQQIFYGSRYQMTMSDMEKAGLNPILAGALGGGGGASAPMAHMTGAGRGGKGENLYIAEKQAENLEAQTNATNALALKHAADTRGIDLDNVDRAGFAKWQAENPTIRRAGYAKQSAGVIGAAYSTAKDVVNEAGGFEGITRKLFPTYFKERERIKNQKPRKSYGGATGTY